MGRAFCGVCSVNVQKGKGVRRARIAPSRRLFEGEGKNRRPSRAYAQ